MRQFPLVLSQVVQPLQVWQGEFPTEKVPFVQVRQVPLLSSEPAGQVRQFPLMLLHEEQEPEQAVQLLMPPSEKVLLVQKSHAIPLI